MTFPWGVRAARRACQRLIRRAQSTGEGGFILLESVIAITVITIVMAAVGAEFVGGMIATSQQRTQQGAVQIASSTMEQIRALKPTDLLSGRDSTSVNDQFTNAIPAVATRLATMDQDSDPTVTSGGISAAIPTCGDNTVPQPTICTQTPGTMTYRIRQYLGKCYIAASGTDCVTLANSGAGSTKYLRAVIAVIWDGPRCGAGCSYVTSTLVSTAADVSFRIDATPYPPPVITAPMPQTHIIGDTLGGRPGDKPPVELKVNDGTGARPLNWTIVSGSLPAGLTLDSLTGLISGTIAERDPAAPITANYTYPLVTIQVTDAFARTSPSVTLSWTVKPALLLTVPASQSTVVNTAATSRTLTAQYGAGPTFTYSIVNNPLPNNLPPGLSLNSSTGVISGTPTTVGTYTVSAKVFDNGNAHSDTETFTWTVTKPYGARYDFEEGSGITAADGTGHGHTATLQPGAGWTIGKVNTKAMITTGASDSWASAAAPVVDTTASLTIAAWVKLDTASGSQGIAGLEGTKVPPFILQRRLDGSFQFTSWRGDAITSASASVASTDKPSTGVWYHVAGVYDASAGTIELYVDGVSQGTSAVVGTFKATGSTMIGRSLYDGQPTDFLNGAVDDVRFFDRPLTSSDINGLVVLGAAGPTGGSVDATGLTGPGSRYSTSTTLNLALAKGTDPDGVSATGAQLLRATAALTAGTCGTYGTYTQVGADNPATPFANTVADGACYRYRYRVVDTLGNSSAYVSPDIKVDGTAPTTGTITYPDRLSNNTSVSISFTNGSESGSGIGTRLLQRASAPLTGTTCGTYTGFATITGGTNPTSPFVDTVSKGSCYKYQYVVSDNVGNTGPAATSPSVVKAGVNYAAAIGATDGLVNWFRLGDSAVSVSSDSFTDSAETSLSNHVGELGAAWSAFQGTGLAKITPLNRLYRSGSNYSGYYTSATPASADYSVQADLVFRSNIINDYAGVIGRVVPGSLTGYGARWQQGNGGGSWVIFEYNNGTLTTLASTPAASRAANQTNRLKLEMVGTALKLYVDGVLTASTNDATITAAGRPGIFDGNPAAVITKTDSTGIQYDNFSVATVPRATDSKGTNTGSYLNGVLLGVAGAIADSADTAATFDGVDDYASVTRTIQDDFSIEFWFKSSGGGIGTGTQWWQGAGMVDAEVQYDRNDFGVSLRSDGRVVAGVGGTMPDVSIVSSAGAYNDGAWHHVVFTRVKTSGAMQLYVDGALAGTATGSKLSLTDPTNINFGRQLDGANYFAGSLDDIAFYSVALSQASVTSHYDAGQ